ncbi:MAG: exodeoxyribonuclease V subunit gamma [Candidatus Thiodiazotropha sp.]
MLRLYQSNRLETLAERLAALFVEPLAEPLRQEQIVVQHPGMARWLSLQLANHLGICANLNFPLPAAFIWGLFHDLLPAVPVCDRFQPKRLAWRIYRLLQDLDEGGVQPPLRDYLLGADEVKRLQLAQQLATVFDRYLLFRPDWIIKWQRGEAATVGDQWQADIWRQLAADDTHHWVSLQLQLSQVSSAQVRAALPPRLFIFGVPTLSPGYLEIIRNIASQTEVHLFLLNPCEAHWADIVSPAEQAHLSLDSTEAELYLEVGHPLLAAMGRQGRDFFAAINEMDPGSEELFRQGGGGSLLHHLQNQILTLETPQELSMTDSSITFHRCHSPLREVEVLYDQLLAALDEIPNLTASDILVMSPDIDRYAPLIQAHFSSPGSRPKIPFRVSGTGLQQVTPLATALLEIVQQEETRYSVGGLLKLLEYPAIRHRFGLNEVGLNKVTRWLKLAAVHWGRDGESKQRLGLPCEPGNTWKAGLRQLMLGYAMPADSEQLWHQTYPLDAVEGSDTQWLGGLLSFCDALFSLEERLSIDRTPEDWLRFLIALTEQFFVADEESEQQLESIRESIHNLVQELDEAGVEQQLPFKVIRHRLQELLSVSQDRGFLGGGVDICALAPMRSLPFRVIALIGMSDDAFPRQQPELGFDLIAQDFRPGDRSRRRDDRYLFLETLISARDRLLISYVGRGQRDNAPIPPSVVVDELSDTLRLMIGESGMEQITFDHPLHAFSQRYFLADTPLFSYSTEMREAALRVGNGIRNDLPLLAKMLPEIEAEGEIDLQGLLHFFTNPLRGLANIRLDLDLEQGEELPEAREQFLLDRFEQIGLEQDLVEGLLAGEPAEAYFQRLRARGYLPQGRVGEQIFSQMQHRANAMVERIQDLDLGESLQPLEVDLEFAEQRLIGHLYGVSAGGLLLYSTERLYPYHLLKHWIQHLLLNLIKPPGVAPRSRLLEGERSGEFKPVEQAGSHLERLLDNYRRGLRIPLPFYPATAWIYQERLGKGDEERAIKAAQQRWLGNHYQGGDLDRPYQRLFWPHRPLLDEDFFATSNEILQPLMDHLEWQG